MKKYIFIAAAFTMLLSSCADFLKETDQDKLVPSQIEHYAAVLMGETEFLEAFKSVDFMTDNVDEYALSVESNRKALKSIFTWQREIEKDEQGSKLKNNVAWMSLYKKIAVANYIIEFSEESNGSQNDKDYVKGEALFLRAYCYFMLTNLYGVPYNQESAKKDLGVILRLETGIQQTYDRASVYDCYAQITTDLIEARRLIEESGIVKSKWHPSPLACDLLLSRVYLYTQNWQKCIEHSSNIITNSVLPSMPATGKYIVETNSDLIYTLSKYLPVDKTAFGQGWMVSDDLINLYALNDLRPGVYFTRLQGTIGRVFTIRKYTWEYSAMGVINFRVAEAYLNRAEAYAHIQQNDKAHADLYALLKTRYNKESDIVLPTDVEILDVILTERRKELCFEESHRWFDLRRMKNRPELTHYFTLTDSNGSPTGLQKFVLLKTDQNYTLPIPLEERENNPLIRNNDRYEKLPVVL